MSTVRDGSPPCSGPTIPTPLSTRLERKRGRPGAAAQPGRLFTPPGWVLLPFTSIAPAVPRSSARRCMCRWRSGCSSTLFRSRRATRISRLRGARTRRLSATSSLSERRRHCSSPRSTRRRRGCLSISASQKACARLSARWRWTTRELPGLLSRRIRRSRDRGNDGTHRLRARTCRKPRRSCAPRHHAALHPELHRSAAEGLGRARAKPGCHVQTHCSESDWEHGAVLARYGRPTRKASTALG